MDFRSAALVVGALALGVLTFTGPASADSRIAGNIATVGATGSLVHKVGGRSFRYHGFHSRGFHSRGFRSRGFRSRSFRSRGFSSRSFRSRGFSSRGFSSRRFR